MMTRSLLLVCVLVASVEGRKKARHRRNYDEEVYTGRRLVEIDTFCGFDNCYDVLGVKRGVNAAAVKRAFRKLSRPVHADKDSSAKAKKAFRRYSQAKEILSNEAKRNEYHTFLDNPSNYIFGSSMGASSAPLQPLSPAAPTAPYCAPRLAVAWRPA